MRDVILHIISLNNGIKSTQLALDVMRRVNPQRFCADNYMKAVESLILSGEIKEFKFSTIRDGSELVDRLYFTRITKYILSIIDEM